MIRSLEKHSLEYPSMTVSQDWQKRIESLGFGTGAPLDSIGHLMTIQDVMGGPLLHENAGVAVSVRPCEDGLKIAFVKRNGVGWTIRNESEASQPAHLKEVILSTVGQYYQAIHDHVNRKSSGCAA